MLKYKVDDWEDLIPEVTPLLEAVATEGAEKYLLRFGITGAKNKTLWTKVLDQASEMARTRSAELVGKRILANGKIVDNPDAKWAITDTTRNDLCELASSAVDKGWTVNQLQHEIVGHESFSPARALTISRTEKAFASSRGEKLAAKGVGMKWKELIPAENDCDECQECADEGRILIDQDFVSGDDAPPIHPSCRCSCGYYETEDGD